MLNDNHNCKLDIMYWLYACRADKNPYLHDRCADSQCPQNDFKILSYLLLVIDFINHIHYCIRIDIIMFILIFLF